MWNKLIRTDQSFTQLALRLTLGIVMLPHGLQKTLGWFGGHGFSATMQFFTEMMHIPALFALLAIAAEFLGALGLIVGLLTRVAAFGIFSVMVVAVLTAHLNVGFFMNWSGQQSGEGFEYHLLAIGIAIALMLRGGGKASMDGQLSK
ncbi:MAG: DoxX family protein [Bacteriovoracia bacterium]